MTWVRRAATTIGATAAMLALGSTAAFAHYCARTDFHEAARANLTTKSQAWIGGEDFYELLAEFLPQDPELPDCFNIGAGLAHLEAFLTHPDRADWVYKGPGLLAGGAEKNGRLPAHFSHALGDAFDEAWDIGMETCPPPLPDLDD